jgi:threonine/homoserine/homoserine lactone efflux protein
MERPAYRGCRALLIRRFGVSRLLERLTGALFVGLGLRLALGERK